MNNEHVKKQATRVGGHAHPCKPHYCRPICYLLCAKVWSQTKAYWCCCCCGWARETQTGVYAHSRPLSAPVNHVIGQNYNERIMDREVLSLPVTHWELRQNLEERRLLLIHTLCLSFKMRSSQLLDCNWMATSSHVSTPGTDRPLTCPQSANAISRCRQLLSKKNSYWLS